MSERDRAYLQTPEQWVHFLSAFVHELRTPLASFRMLADLLAEAPKDHLGTQERRYSENIREVVQDIQALVGDVGELARLLGGRVQLRPEEVALETLVDEIEEAVRPRAWEGGIALTDSLARALPAAFRTDRDRLRQLLVLLLSAAVSHAKSEVFFHLDAGGGNLRAVISSDGPPFPEGQAQAAFEPFNDGIRAARQRGGRSLALPLASELARALGGALRAENREGKPAFELSVPAAD
ncbi:MAG TPA: HAMP domain-containing sensor histidine kinase [Thermoanaerobaculia bacterium]|nr:HAMP domain-containing sensor histidine kinase [Thermoanaerobaculia bacterium]